jgi:hypothetical protein
VRDGPPFDIVGVLGEAKFLRDGERAAPTMSILRTTRPIRNSGPVLTTLSTSGRRQMMPLTCNFFLNLAKSRPGSGQRPSVSNVGITENTPLRARGLQECADATNDVTRLWLDLLGLMGTNTMPSVADVFAMGPLSEHHLWRSVSCFGELSNILVAPVIENDGNF